MTFPELLKPSNSTSAGQPETFWVGKENMDTKVHKITWTVPIAKFHKYRTIRIKLSRRT